MSIGRHVSLISEREMTMSRRAFRRGVALLIVFAVIGGGSLVIVKAATIKVGDRLVVTARATVMDGEKTLSTVDVGTELEAKAVSGNWVAVSVDQPSGTATGWIPAKNVVLKSEALSNKPADSPAQSVQPRELAMQSLPTYQIEPSDIISIELQKLVPIPPYRVKTYDVVQIDVLGTIVDAPINGYFLIGDDGTVTLGPVYGKVRIAGMTTEEAADEIRSKLELILARPDVSVQLARGTGLEPVSGDYLVAIDGTVNLGRYGAVDVAGKTIVEARLAVEKHLEQYFDSPEISVAVSVCNSKFCYVVTESSKLGDNVVRLPVTGKETVLDVISQLGGLSQVSSRRISIARPAPPDAGKEIVLPVDWLAITRRGSTATNYQIFPGDRIVIAENSEAAAMNSAALLEKGRTLHE